MTEVTKLSKVPEGSRFIFVLSMVPEPILAKDSHIKGYGALEYFFKGSLMVPVESNYDRDVTIP